MKSTPAAPADLRQAGVLCRATFHALEMQPDDLPAGNGRPRNGLDGAAQAAALAMVRG